MADADQKTEAPTDKKRADAAKRGEVWQSRELGTALIVAAGVAWLAMSGAALAQACAALLAAGLGGGALPVAALVAPLGSFAGLVVAASVVGPLLLGSRWSSAAAAPKASRLSPFAGLKRMVGLQGPIELGKSLVKAVVLAGAGWAALDASRAAPGDLLAGAAGVGNAMTALLIALALALVVIALVDLPLTRFQWLAKLRMTLQEVRDERKEAEGSPEVRAAQRRQARAAARAALRPAMAAATVVTINPSEFAVALRYRPGIDACPVVVAKGQGIVAGAIRDLAAELRVPVLRYPLLTRGIFFTAKVGAPIRDDLFGAVAAILAYVFSVDAAAPPLVEVPVAARFDERGRLRPSSSAR